MGHKLKKGDIVVVMTVLPIYDSRYVDPHWGVKSGLKKGTKHTVETVYNKGIRVSDQNYILSPLHFSAGTICIEECMKLLKELKELIIHES